MGFRLVVDSMPNVRQLAPPHLLAKVQSGENVLQIAEELHITIEQTTKHVVELIKRGKLITISDLKTFCGGIDQYDSTEIHDQLTDEDLCASAAPNASESIVDRIHNECPIASKIFIEVVLAYYQARHHLKRQRHPYVDVADETLVNGKLLIPESVPKPKGDSEYDGKPWRFNSKTDIIDMDAYFGNRVDDPDDSNCSESDENNSQEESDGDEVGIDDNIQIGDAGNADSEEETLTKSDTDEGSEEETQSECDRGDDSEYDLPLDEYSNDSSQIFDDSDEEYSLWNNNDFDPTYRYREPSETNDDSNRQQSESTIRVSIESVVETYDGSNLNDGVPPTTSTMKRTSSFHMSIGSGSGEDIDEDELCVAVMDTYETLFETPAKMAKIPLHRSDA